MRDEGTDRSDAEWSSTPAGHITPADVQQKQFRTARLGGGYRMREVDEFLDQVTDTLSSLIAENDRLRRDRGSGSPAPAAPAVLGQVADPAAIDAFLRHEKGFLQSLGSLVQAHAEELKRMVRAARSAPPAAPTSTEPASAPLEAVTPEPAEPSAAGEPEATGPPTAISAASTEDETQGEEEDAGELVDLQDEPASSDRAGTEEAIRLDEPEPAEPKRSEEGSAGSLRELFWGEE